MEMIPFGMEMMKVDVTVTKVRNNSRSTEVQTITMDELLIKLQQDTNIAQQFAQQLGIETTNPKFIVQEIINQLQTSYEAKLWLDQGVQQYEAGDLQRAIDCCNKAIKIKPRYYQAWSGRSNVLCHLGHLEEALASCDKALEIEPGYHEAWKLRGIALSHLG